MLRVHLPQWYSLSDSAMEEGLSEVSTMRRFAGIDRIPGETMILIFRQLLEKNSLGEQIFETVKAHLPARAMTIHLGTIVDASLMAAPSFTKNKAGEHYPEMHQTKKGNQWYFGKQTKAREAVGEPWDQQGLRPDLLGDHHTCQHARPHRSSRAPTR